MKTKKQLVDDILKIKKVDSRSNLMKLRNDELEAILEDLQVEDEVEQDEPVAKEKKIPQKKKIDRDTVVGCRNLTSGRLTYISKKTGMETVWSEFGDEEYLDVAELLTMKTSQPAFLKEPWLFIDDEEIVEYLGLREMYKTIIPIDEVEEFFGLSTAEAKKIIPRLPKGMKTLIGEMARKGIQDETLTNTKMIRLLQDELNLDLFSLMD